MAKKIPTKKKRVLIALTERRYHRFQAERLLSDHCLHSTVSTLQNNHGIEIQRKFVTVSGYMGIDTRVCEYWIADDKKEEALKIAKFWS